MFLSGRTHTEAVSAHSSANLGVADVCQALATQAPELVCEAGFTPLPCGDPNCHTIGYLLRTPAGIVGLSKFVDLSSLQGFRANRVDYRIDDLLQCGCETEPLGQILKGIEVGPELPFRL